MCGIFGYTGDKPAVPIILKGLSRLEYRGYDSAGVAVFNGTGKIKVSKRKGKVSVLAELLEQNDMSGSLGLGHTRWATHGAPNDQNAHPHQDTSQDLAIVHNGIIENYFELKTQLQKEGFIFASETDSEVLAHLISKFYRKKSDLKEAVRKALLVVRGTYAIGVIHRNEPGRMIVSRVDSPLIIGLGKDENFISSDIPALLDHTHQVVTPRNGDVVVVESDRIRIFNPKGKRIRRSHETVEWDVAQAEKDGFPHFMLKEIFEQPRVVEHILQCYVKKGRVVFDQLNMKDAVIKKIKNIVIVACGTSYHAGMVGRYVLEEFTPLEVSVDTSSEFRYRDPKVNSKSLVIVISQSGETADTLAALREAKKRGAYVLAICNVLGSTIDRESHGVIHTHAGPEIAVASTKAYTAQMAVLYLLALFIRRILNPKKDPLTHRILKGFRDIPQAMQKVLDRYDGDKEGWNENVHKFNKRYHEQLKNYFEADPEHRKRAPNAFFLYLGRNINYPSALEGALKLKEIAYISAEGYPAGEMKHGPIALIDENPWVICIAVKSGTYDKMISNIQEIQARGGLVTAIITEGDEGIKRLGLYLTIDVPSVEEILSPFVVAIPLQLIAYSVAEEFGEDIDQPRNLAKSVTVE
jgi:glutamine---fructose-6-phosphate transaminase (isomerizing)